MKREIEKQIIAVCNATGKRPFVPSVTNFVTAEFVANCQLAVGASPAVLNLPDEACAAAEAADAFYINLGTVLPVYKDTVPCVAEKLCSLQKPWVLDPVAAGLGALRTEILLRLREYRPQIVRANASETITLAKLWNLHTQTTKVRGVDSTAEVEAARQAAVAIAKFTGGAVAVSGENDLVTDGNCIAISHGGSCLMERITGCGCALGGVAAFYLSFGSPFVAALCATNAFNAAGRAAAQKSPNPGSFKAHFLDELYMLDGEKIANNPFEVEKL